MVEFKCRTGNRRFSQPARSMRRHLFKQRLVAEQPFQAELHPPLRFPDDVFPIFAGGSQALRSAASDGNRAPLPDAGRCFRPGLRGPVPMGKPMRALAKAKASNGESTIGSSSSEAIGAVSVFAAILGKPAGHMAFLTARCPPDGSPGAALPPPQNGSSRPPGSAGRRRRGCRQTPNDTRSRRTSRPHAP